MGFGRLGSALHKPVGKLVLVVGPSGVGKDTLINLAKEQLAAKDGFHFPTRYITRSKDAGAEQHIAISPQQFCELKARNEFILCWAAHGLNYGIAKTIDQHLAAGETVVVNVSRSVIEDAQKIFANVKIIHITASKATLLQRLQLRGREAPDSILTRLNRLANYDVSGKNVQTIYNDGLLTHCYEKFVGALY